MILFWKGKSLLPCIVTHGVVNSLSIFSVQGSRLFDIVTAAAMCAISVGYALWIIKKSAAQAGKTELG